MGEVIGGSHLRALVVRRRRNSIGIDQLGKKKLGIKSHGTKRGTMEDRQTKTIGEVCRATYQKEEESGPRKPVPGGAFGYCGLARLHWEGKRRVVFKSV